VLIDTSLVHTVIMPGLPTLWIGRQPGRPGLFLTKLGAREEPAPEAPPAGAERVARASREA